MPLNPSTSYAGPDDERPGAARLRIGVHRLPAPDVMLVRAFVHMSSTYTENFPWVFAEEPPFDLVLIDSNERLRQDPGRQAGEVLLITDGNAHSPNMMQRPLRFRVLEDWLKQRAVEIRSERLQRPKQLERSAPSAVAELPSRTDFHIRKLDRWPPSGFLQHDRLRLRVATMLTANGMNLSDLARLCRQPEELVRDCVRAFRDAGLLQFEPATLRAAAPPQVLARPGNAPDSAQKPKAGFGFIASIRRRLGL